MDAHHDTLTKPQAIVGGLIFVVLILTALGLADRIDRDADERIDYQRWVAQACIPAREGETVVSSHDGKRLTCTIYSRASMGMARSVVSAAAIEVPR